MQSDTQSRWNTRPAEYVPIAMNAVEASTHVDPDSHVAYWYRPDIWTHLERYTPNSSKDHKTWKNFQHYKCVSSSSSVFSPSSTLLTCDCGFSNKYADTGYSNDPYVFYNGYYGLAGQFNNGLDAIYVPDSDGNFVLPPSGLSDLSAYALKCMMPKIKAELSSINSIIELKDLLSIKGTVKNLANMVRYLLGALRGKGIKPLAKSLPRSAADSFLQWKFNLAPLISDIAGIYRAIAGYEKRINDFVTRSGKLLQSHFKCDLKTLKIDDSSSWTGFTQSCPPPIINGTARENYCRMSYQRDVKWKCAEFRATMQYNYQLSAYQIQHAQILGILDAFGINFNPAIIWNALPWSFVVDWVIGVSQWLDNFKVANLAPKVNILQYCCSVKYQREISVRGLVRCNKYFLGWDAVTCYAPVSIVFPKVTETAYRRIVGLPDTSSITLSGLNSSEFSLGAALIISQRRRPKRGRKS